MFDHVNHGLIVRFPKSLWPQIGRAGDEIDGHIRVLEGKSIEPSFIPGYERPVPHPRKFADLRPTEAHFGSCSIDRHPVHVYYDVPSLTKSSHEKSHVIATPSNDKERERPCDTGSDAPNAGDNQHAAQHAGCQYHGTHAE